MNNNILYAKKCNIGGPIGNPIGEIWIPQNEPCDMWANWEVGIRNFLMNRVTNKTHFIDIGANIGYFSLWVATKAERVFSVEPNPILYEALKDNALKFPSVIKTYMIALGDKRTYGYEGHRAFYYRVDAAGDGRSYNPTEYGDGNKWLMSYIPNETLSSFQDKYFPGIGINLIKIDCESFEYEILMGSDSFCSFFNRIENKDCEIVLELHRKIIEDRKLDYLSFARYLNEHWNIHTLNGEECNPCDIEGTCHLLLTRKDRDK